MSDIVSDLIWVLTACKGFQQTPKVVNILSSLAGKGIMSGQQKVITRYGYRQEIRIAIYCNTKSPYRDMYHNTYHENIDSLSVRR